ncbi:MAG: Hpt domain-containing protein [Desulfonatronovibrionaceae bacterium]
MDKTREYLESLDSVFCGDRTMIFRACQSFLNHCDGYMDVMNRACQARNGPELQRIAHAFKSSFVMFGDAAATNAALEMEKRGQENNWDGVNDVLNRFCLQLESVRNTSSNLLKGDCKRV